MDLIAKVLFFYYVLATALSESTSILNTSRRKSIVDDKAVEATGTCQEDYSPCYCDSVVNGEATFLYVYCTDIASLDAVQSVFRRTTTKSIREFNLRIPPTENTIPADLLDDKGARDIYISCSSQSTPLVIHSNAFNASQDYTIFMQFSNCNFNTLNYAFLNNFNVLNTLSYYDFTNIPGWTGLPGKLPSLRKIAVNNGSQFEGFQNLPVSSLPALNELSVTNSPIFKHLPTIMPPNLLAMTVDNCPLFQQWDVLGSLTQIQRLTLNRFTSQKIEDALNSMASLSDILTSLTLMQNELTFVPPHIRSYSKLENVDLSYNNFSTVTNNSLVFSSNVLRSLKLTYDGMQTIESAAFQDCFINLSSNNLTRFERSVFEPILQQMLTGYLGDRGIDVYNQKFECDCHLAWLFRDTSGLRNLVYDGMCSSGAYFASLNAYDFTSCTDDGQNITSTSTLAPTTNPSSSTARPKELLGPVFLIIALITLYG